MKIFLETVSQKIIEVSFYLLFFFVPLILSPYNYELFEYNKMMLTYGLTAIIVTSWIIKIILSKQIKIAKTPLDIPIILFLISQIVATIISIDPHVSLFGYYSRFNGGLLSTITYILLYYSFVSHFPREKLGRLFIFMFTSATLVAFYGVLEHFGIDRDLWVQDVQNRVFSTLGQPNWLGAYLSVLIFPTLGIALYRKGKVSILSLAVCFLFFITFLYTKSRSALLGFVSGEIVFWSLHLLKYKSSLIKYFISINAGFLLIIFFIGTPFEQINRFTYEHLMQQSETTDVQTSPQQGTSVLETGITDSGTIRQIVWKGAIDIIKQNPFIGTGVETFAFSYYKYRPAEHNLTSEWDFLYNKAHNEYLNFGANSGLFGLGSYLLLIGVFILWNLKNLKSTNPSHITHHTQLSFFAGWITILVTNFFGFSVVIIQLLFFLIPAFLFVNHHSVSYRTFLSENHSVKKSISFSQYVFLFIIFLTLSYCLTFLARMWYADTLFAKGHTLVQSDVLTAYRQLTMASQMNSQEPLYFDELSYPSAQLALLFSENNDTTTSAQLIEEAVTASNWAIRISPSNVNFWKTRTRVFYLLSQIDEKYLSDSFDALLHAKALSPTDPKIRYNIALLYDKFDKRKEAYDELMETTALKPDFREAYYALAFFYDRDGQKSKAIESLQYILTHIATDDADTKKKLEELK